jgi:hypothetical protein
MVAREHQLFAFVCSFGRFFCALLEFLVLTSFCFFSLGNGTTCTYVHNLWNKLVPLLHFSTENSQKCCFSLFCFIC